MRPSKSYTLPTKEHSALLKTQWYGSDVWIFRFGAVLACQWQRYNSRLKRSLFNWYNFPMYCWMCIEIWNLFCIVMSLFDRFWLINKVFLMKNNILRNFLLYKYKSEYIFFLVMYKNWSFSIKNLLELRKKDWGINQKLFNVFFISGTK